MFHAAKVLDENHLLASEVERAWTRELYASIGSVRGQDAQALVV